VKLICEAGTGFNNIDIDACRQRGICVMNVPSYSSSAVASLVITFILNFSCGLISQQKKLWNGDRSNFTSFLHEPHFELEGKTLGLVGGRGTIGSKVSALATALGMKVVVSTRRTPPISTDESAHDIIYTSSIEEIFRCSDFISLHCPLSSETHHLINSETLALMKPTAFLINTARGGLIDEDALVCALNTGAIAGAALDVQVFVLFNRIKRM